MAEEQKQGFWGRLFNAHDLTTDIKLIMFGVVTVSGVIMLSRELKEGPMTQEWVDAFKWLLLSASIGGGAWSLVDRLMPLKPKDGGKKEGE